MLDADDVVLATARSVVLSKLKVIDSYASTIVVIILIDQRCLCYYELSND